MYHTAKRAIIRALSVWLCCSRATKPVVVAVVFFASDTCMLVMLTQ